MKKLSICIILVISGLYLSAQSQLFPGYYITRTNDTIHGEFWVPCFSDSNPDFVYLQNKISFNDKDQIKQDIKPRSVIEINFTIDDTPYKMLTRKNTIDVVQHSYNNSSFVFLHLVQDGYVKVFQYYLQSGSSSNNNSQNNATARFAVQMGKNELVKIKGINFKKEMAELFIDCEELTQKITNKEYTKDNLLHAVEEYNRWHTNDMAGIENDPSL